MAPGPACGSGNRLLAAVALVLAAVAGCTPRGASFLDSVRPSASPSSVPAAAPERCGVPPRPVGGGARTLVRAATPNPHFAIVAAAALPDGSVVFAREANAAVAGREVRDRQPALITLDAGGRCTPFDRPVVADRRIAPSAVPVAVGPDGQLYLWDPPSRRLVRGTPGSEWRTVATVPASLATHRSFPAVTVARDGAVYVASDASVWRATPDAHLVLAAGAPQGFYGASEQPAGSLRHLPRRAISDSLPSLGAVASTADGRLIVTTGASVLEVDRSGTLRLLAGPATTHGQAGAIAPGSILTGAAVTPNGDVLLGDTATQRVLRIHDGRSTLLADGPSALLSLDATSSRLLVAGAGGRTLAVLGLPDG